MQTPRGALPCWMSVRGRSCDPGRKGWEWVEEKLDRGAVIPWEAVVAFRVMLSWGRRVRLSRS